MPLLTSSSVQPCVAGSEGGDMEAINVKYLGISAQLRDEQEEREQFEAVRLAVSTELAARLQAFVAVERNVVRLTRGEVKRLWN